MGVADSDWPIGVTDVMQPRADVCSLSRLKFVWYSDFQSASMINLLQGVKLLEHIYCKSRSKCFNFDSSICHQTNFDVDLCTYA